ncbi:MAG: MBL fold metallo-hydrolase [Gemmatimonadota bacterium]|nr:MBL fold metallo-hydrolase [Gemmatimonadota bacterium]MDQ8168575.1 MBL fold metallo-hydrolase [Gemmatimonadota bacterium]MDQ8172717.1 MBL fold metallo-hydrolase [Gemmatimonadota bacterium]
MRRLLFPLLLLAAVRLGAQSPVRTADPAVRGVPLSAFPRFVKLSDKVYGYEEIRQPGFTTVSLIVIGRNGVLVADGQGSVQATQTMLDRIKTLTPLPVKWYVVGSDHGDHTAGNSALPKDIQFVVHANSLAQLKKDSAAAVAANRPAVVMPKTAMTSDTETLDLGGISVRVRFLGRAHTGGDLMLEVPSEKLLFMSEAYLNRVFPAMRSAYGAEWVRTIDRALALTNVERFIPGHGFIEDAAVSREELVTFRESLVAVMAEVKRLKAAGLTVEQAIAQVNWGPYAQWFLAEQQSPIAIRRLWTELDGASK